MSLYVLLYELIRGMDYACHVTFVLFVPHVGFLEISSRSHDDLLNIAIVSLTQISEQARRLMKMPLAPQDGVCPVSSRLR